MTTARYSQRQFVVFCLAFTLALGFFAMSVSVPMAHAAGCTLPDYPRPDCTGVPTGTTFTNTVGSYTASTNNQVIDGWHITGDLTVTANNVTIKNTQVDGTIVNDIASASYMTNIMDTTIGVASSCVVSPGIDTPNDMGGYTATRVKIIGHDDGFRAGGSNITVRDSYVKNCGFSASHGDGIQDYPYADNLVFDHNTMDLCGQWSTVPTSTSGCNVPGHNSPIFVHSSWSWSGGPGSRNVTITNNLALGGVYTLYLLPHSTWTITGNRVVNNTWDYSAYENEASCAGTWSDNTVVTMNANYQVTGTLFTADNCSGALHAVSGGGDTTPPTSPTNLAANATSSSSITVSWTAATDNVGVVRYDVERCLGLSCSDFAQVGTAQNSPFTDSSLTASTGYSYHVRAVDAAGNVSGWSNVVGATTQSVSDTQAPTVPTNLSATAISSSQINLSWTASTDNVSVTGYRIFRDGVQVGTSSGANYSDVGLSPSTNYSYVVNAIDAAGNISANSNTANATTQGGGSVYQNAIEAESATVSNGASVGSDVNASGGQFLQFASATGVGSNSCPAYPSFPDTSCTGVPAGTTLTVKSGNQTISTAGMIIDGWDVRGKLIINAQNVTVKNSIVHGPAAGGCSNGAAIEVNANYATIQDTEVVMDNPTACLDGIWLNANYATLTRLNVHGGTDGIKAATSPFGHDYLIQDSYIHDMKWWATDPNQGGGDTHNDGIQSWGGASNVTLTHNRIDMSTVLDSGGQMVSNSAWQDGATNSRAEYNYLDGGGCTLNFAWGSGSVQPIYVNYNHFGRHQGFTGCVVLINNAAVMTQYNGNIWQDTGLAVPNYQQHD